MSDKRSSYRISEILDNNEIEFILDTFKTEDVATSGFVYLEEKIRNDEDLAPLDVRFLSNLAIQMYEEYYGDNWSKLVFKIAGAYKTMEGANIY